MNKTIFNVLMVIFVIGAMTIFCGEMYCQDTLNHDLQNLESLQPEDAGMYEVVRDGMFNYSAYNRTNMGVGSYKIANIKITLKGVVKDYSDEFNFNR